MNPLTLTAAPDAPPPPVKGGTWDSIEEMRRGMALMLQDNPYFAWQHTDGGYRPCQDLAQLERHARDIFDGRKTAGFYSIRPDNLTRWGAIDFDAHGGVGTTRWRETARRAFEAATAKFSETWFVESSPGGFHVIGFADAPQPAADIRSIFTAIAPGRVEVFPKQDTLRDDPKAKGSLLRFPGKHQRRGTWARFIATSGRIVDVDGMVPRAEVQRHPRRSLLEPLRHMHTRN